MIFVEGWIHWLCHLGLVCIARALAPPMHTPSPESLIQAMTCISATCEVGHRQQKTWQQKDSGRCLSLFIVLDDWGNKN
tara:strand:+ start:1168 stop:1404 length:237 start_codon:yes stop_codon:yes gene_type:complete